MVGTGNWSTLLLLLCHGKGDVPMFPMSSILTAVGSNLHPPSGVSPPVSTPGEKHCGGTIVG